jgi:hypothetical protein
MTNEEKQALAEKIGNDASNAIQKKLEAFDEKAKAYANEAVKGMISKETFETWQTEGKNALKELEEIATKQGTTLTEIALKMTSSHVGTKSISQTLKDDEEELRKVYANGSGNKAYMINVGEKGEFVMKPFDQSKAVGPVASIAGVNGGTAASIFQAIDSASLLRLGGDSAIYSQYRNTKWVFELCNIINADYNTLMAMWYEEVVKTGSSGTTPEGTAKSLVQYAYNLKTSTYKKEAMLIGFTEEFSLDFARLQSDILGKGRVDVMNRINTAVLADIIAAATPYNSALAYKNGAVIPTVNYNDYLSIDALAAQVDNATFGQVANAAVMSTFKNHRVNTQMNSYGEFLMPPASLAGLAMVGNPAMATDDLLVGDFKQYNIILRGGLIVRIGYNGNDFAQNMFSAVIEQYYMDYISTIRAQAIVKGSTFAAVKTAITT